MKATDQRVSTFRTDAEFAHLMDAQDPLRKFREGFLIPELDGKESIYLCGNSLGPAPRKARDYILEEFDDWAKMGVEGHWAARHPWLPYHQFVTESLADLVGALPIEVVAMNSLTVNLNMMMVSFYRPTKQRYKVLIEETAFPSDRYAISQQCKFHGYDPKDAILELKPRDGEDTLRTDDIVSFMQEHGDSIALVLIGNVNYLTGQSFNIAAITEAGHKLGLNVGWDLAHAVGNVPLNLHDDGPDFAVWCSYKYLNSGPGAIAGCFVHERHAHAFELPRFVGWWAHDKATRFQMDPDFVPIPGVEGWQNSNPPIFQLAALRASLEIFDEASMKALREKSVLLTGYLEFLLDQIPGQTYEIKTPRDPAQRGCHLSLAINGADPQILLEHWKEAGIICDFRKPNIIRVAPAPLFNRFEEVYKFVEILKQLAA